MYVCCLGHGESHYTAAATHVTGEPRRHPPARNARVHTRAFPHSKSASKNLGSSRRSGSVRTRGTIRGGCACLIWTRGRGGGVKGRRPPPTFEKRRCLQVVVLRVETRRAGISWGMRPRAACTDRVLSRDARRWRESAFFFFRARSFGAPNRHPQGRRLFEQAPALSDRLLARSGLALPPARLLRFACMHAPTDPL